MAPLLEIANLSKTLSGNERRVLFANVTATLSDSEIVVLLGPSGQGKSTLLRIIALLDKADSGTIRYKQKSAEEWSPQEWRKSICYVAQQAVMLAGSVEDNLRAVSFLHRTAFDSTLARHLMGAVGLAGMKWDKNAGELSGGEKQRVALVRSLLLRPHVLLLDEITASLDPHSKQAVERLLTERQASEGTVIIWVTHDLDQARSVSSRIWLLGSGGLAEDAPASSFFQRPASADAKRFLQMEEDEVACPT